MKSSLYLIFSCEDFGSKLVKNFSVHELEHIFGQSIPLERVATWAIRAQASDSTEDKLVGSNFLALFSTFGEHEVNLVQREYSHISYMISKSAYSYFEPQNLTVN